MLSRALLLLTAAVVGQIDQGAITVNVRTAKSDQPVTVYIEWREGSRVPTLPAGERHILTRNLDFGEYYVSATQGDVHVSTIQRVTISRSQPTATVDLDLAENHSSLLIVDQQWRPVAADRVGPISPAHYLMGRTNLLRETTPGEYSLDNLRPGMFVKIKAQGFVSACVTVPRNDRVVARLETGRRVEIRLPRDMTPAVVRELSALSGIPGSDCPVPLRELDFQLVGEDIRGQPLTYRSDHFSSASRFELRRFPSPPRQIVVPDRGDIIIED
jgi:hypothetical protein